ncbi:MAG: ATP-binding cassette domain-containing protein [Myxococcales bacterium]|nr:ATP-binding cassette domain-containing protein [Myxococcales bacterium]
MSALAFEDVEKRFGQTVALRGVSLCVEGGAIFGLLGPNGAGKTTLIRIGLDIVRPDAGEVRLFDGPICREALDRVGYLPEERGLYRGAKVLEMLVYLAQLKGLRAREARRRARDWLERIGLGHVEGWKIEALSKGMGQKVQLASTLLWEPELCILDEPFSGLDPLNVGLVEAMILERREKGLATVLSTHLMGQVESLCDRVAIIHDGELVVEGGIDEVRARHSRAEVRLRLRGELPASLGLRVIDQESTGALRLELGDRAPDELLAALIGAGARVESFERVVASVEEIFLGAVREEREP